MTPSRLACIIITELHSAGYPNMSPINEPVKVVQAAIEKRIKWGDVVCIEDEDEKNLVRHSNLH